MTTITNNKLTDERVSNATLIRLIQWADQHNSHYVAAALCELQERRKADNQEPAGYHVIKECGKVGCSVATLEEAEKTRDFWNKKWTIRPYFYSAAPAPVVPEECPAELPYAQVKAAADLYALCWQSGEVVTYTPDPEKATIWLNNYSGTCVQEYVKLERLQEALFGYSPVIPRVYLADINTDHQH
ncbi:Eaa protein [Salmonella enterica]|uniref:Eaa protein n=2 Tax=Salmonella enterica subsp. arizonae serovar 18:z4,z23:- TaxID=1192839 RepID=A0A3S5YMJ4_SALER|nr:Eaa protein [Salmonella enterica]EBV8287177.1 Eaa protein [Salmonella enterica subsp. arizonae serovar 18:z4,z23:-]EBV9429118.1 Eaa protein [Salmonella enterica subsp. enterica serovar Heidelberg]ECC3302210.1 Eaa protein [Salmonella enterica subsp. arizonae]ECE0067079.1 Eaa protein [Salmonella enterica subsp. enterica]ECU7349426.1 Eaa protein [Salmonella enterica subsp. enterica serovar Kentucky]EDB5608823.1 Eaa protein [Salmonella enterica subsp. enterica serovar Infantis]EDN5647695.1 Ea